MLVTEIVYRIIQCNPKLHEVSGKTVQLKTYCKGSRIIAVKNSKLVFVGTSMSNIMPSLAGDGWCRGTVVERRSLAGELSLSCARPAADG